MGVSVDMQAPSPDRGGAHACVLWTGTHVYTKRDILTLTRVFLTRRSLWQSRVHTVNNRAHTRTHTTCSREGNHP